MSIGALSGVSGATQTAAVSEARASRKSSIPPAGPGASAAISPLGQLLAQLQDLQAQDPAKFKQVTGDIADKLKAASAGTDSATADPRMTDLASKFSQASQSGDLSSFRPSGAQGHHHHGHHYGGAAPTASAAPSPTSSLQQLFASFSSEVEGALGASAKTTS